MKFIEHLFGKRTAWIAGAMLLSGSVLNAALSASEPPGPITIKEKAGRTVAFEAKELTHSHVDISPDGRTLLFDLLGHIYTAPVEGGLATQLTHDDAWNMQPRYSPEGRRIALISDRSGKFEFWVSAVDGGELTEYPGLYSQFERFGPAWDANGNLVSAKYTPTGFSVSAWSSPSKQRLILQGDKSAFGMGEGAWSRDGKYLYYGGDGIYRKDIASGDVTRIGEKAHDYPHEMYVLPRVSRNGGVLTYFLKKGDSDAGVCVLHALNIQSGRLTRFDESQRPCPTWGRRSFDLPDYALLPDGSAAIVNDAGRLVRFEVATGRRSVLPLTVPVVRTLAPPPLEVRPDASPGSEVRAKVIRWPKLTADGSKLVFNAFSKNYVKDLKTGATRRLTSEASFESAPAISPDGRWVAYSTWSDVNLGHVMVVPIEGGTPRTLTRAPGRYLNPAWSHDGRKLAFVSDEDELSRNGLRTNHESRSEMSLQFAQLTASGEVVAVQKVAPLSWAYRFDPTQTNAMRFHPVPTFLPRDTRLIVPIELHAIDESQKPGMGLLSVDLDGRNPKRTRLLPHVDEAQVSPDGKHLAAVSRGRLHVLPLRTDKAGNVIEDIALTSASEVSGPDPVYVTWSGPDTIVWAEAAGIYRYRLSDHSVTALTTVDVRLPRFKPSGCIAFIHARLLTMVHQRVIENATLQICGDRIVAIGASDAVALPKGIRTIDVRGKTLIPGLVDTHAHVSSIESESWPAQEVKYVSNLAYGVTSLFDPQAHLLESLGRAEMVEIGDGVGPRVYSSGPGIMSLDTVYDHTGPVIRNAEDALSAVLARSRYGAGPLKSYADDRRDRRQLLVRAARKEGVNVTSHPHYYENAMSGVLDGISLEHGITIADNIEVHDDVLQLIAASGVSYTVDFLGAGTYRIDSEDPKLNRLMPRSMFNVPLAEQETVYSATERVQNARSLTRLSALGGLPTIGAHGRVPPGLATHHDLWALVDNGGMTPYDALRVASLNGAKKIGMGTQMGTLEVGKLADLIVLNSNPLDRIQNTIDIRYVMRGGLMYDGPTMTRLWPDYQPLAPWRWQSEADRRQLMPSVTPRLPGVVH